MAILLSVVLTFFGAAACYRAVTHMRMTVRATGCRLLPKRGNAGAEG